MAKSSGWPLTKAMAEKLKRAGWRSRYRLRKQIVEPVFGWVTDGTAASTTMVEDINPGSGSSSPSLSGALGNGSSLFIADDGTHGRELWVTDGTAEGNALIEDINPGTASSSPYFFTALGNGSLLFSADDGTHGRELWVDRRHRCGY